MEFVVCRIDEGTYRDQPDQSYSCKEAFTSEREQMSGASEGWLSTDPHSGWREQVLLRVLSGGIVLGAFIAIALVCDLLMSSDARPNPLLVAAVLLSYFAFFPLRLIRELPYRVRAFGFTLSVFACGVSSLALRCTRRSRRTNSTTKAQTMHVPGETIRSVSPPPMPESARRIRQAAP